MPARTVSSVVKSIRYVGRAIGGLELVLSLVGVAVLAVAAGWPGAKTAEIVLVVGALITVASLGFFARQERAASATNSALLMGTHALPRVLLVAAATVTAEATERRWWVVLAAAVLMALIVGEAAVRRPVKGATPQAANFTGGDIPIPSLTATNWYFVATTITMLLFAVTAALGATQVPTVVATCVALAVALIVALQSARYLVGRNRFERDLPKLLAKYGPEFAFHWQAPVGTAYQAAMWLPYLERIGRPFFVLVRTQANFDDVSKMTSAPVILRVGLEDLDPVICPSLKTVFYANTAVRNSHMIRFPALTHIQLNHGDSDKIASVSPTFRQYDRNFVAGQAAIDRFAQHGVSTLPEQFEIVGRPQLEDVRPPEGPISDISTPTVLYSPTWSGFYEDSDYSSLSAGPHIVTELLKRGCTVIFRPHPYARRHSGNARACDEVIALLNADAAESGRQHVYGETAEVVMSVVDCFNACDAMISDVSSLVSDFLMSGKPFAMAAVSAKSNAFVDEFPQAKAAYVFDAPRRSAKTDGLAEALDAMLGADPLAQSRASLRSYYLSDTPAEQIAERFLETARRYL